MDVWYLVYLLFIVQDLQHHLYVPSRVVELCTCAIAIVHKFKKYDLFVPMLWQDCLKFSLEQAPLHLVKQFYDVAEKVEEDFQIYFPEKGIGINQVM